MKRLVIPIRNREDPFFDVAPWFLGKAISIDEICDEDFGALFRHDGELFESVVTAKTQCLTVELDDEADPNQIAYEVLTIAQYVFKALGESPLAVSHAAVVSSIGSKKANVERALTLPVWGDATRLAATRFSFKDNVSLEQVIELFKVVCSAVAKHQPLIVTLNRFNSCWLREIDHDRIIDAAICLESILTSSTEIAFKFSLFNAFIAKGTPQERHNAFRLLKELYDARSAIVHGDIKSRKKKIDAVIRDFDKILDLAQAAITYYLLFIYSNKPSEIGRPC